MPLPGPTAIVITVPFRTAEAGVSDVTRTLVTFPAAVVMPIAKLNVTVCASSCWNWTCVSAVSGSPLPL